MTGLMFTRRRQEPEERIAEEGGFSLIDVCVTLSVSVILLYALHSGTQTAMKTRRAVESNYQEHLFAGDFLNRIRRLPFGNPSDPTPTAEQLSEIFDDDQDLGTISLMQLRVAPDTDGYSFKIASQEVTGTWRVRVTSDLNGDGDATDAREGRSDLLRAEIYYKDRLMLETLRAAGPTMTKVDSAANYISGLPAPPKRGGGTPPAEKEGEGDK